MCTARFSSSKGVGRPPCRQTPFPPVNRQTGVTFLSCPKLRLHALKIELETLAKMQLKLYTWELFQAFSPEINKTTNHHDLLYNRTK